MKKKTLSILIPAHNEEGNIVFLVQSLLEQNSEFYKLKSITVASDGSSDSTVKVLKKIKSNNLTILDYKTRKGKATRLNQMFAKTNSDIVVLLDADIVIDQVDFIDNLILPIIKDKADLTSSAINELKPRTFFESILGVSMSLKKELFGSFKNGNNVYNCHGPARAISSNFYKFMRFQQSSGEDMYSYLWITSHDGRFAYVPNIQVSYSLPAVPVDHYKQSFRYMEAMEKMKEYFDIDFVNKELSIPTEAFIKGALRSFPIFMKYPLYTILYVLTCITTIIGNKLKIRPRELWLVKSSKQIIKAH